MVGRNQGGVEVDKSMLSSTTSTMSRESEFQGTAREMSVASSDSESSLRPASASAHVGSLVFI